MKEENKEIRGRIRHILIDLRIKSGLTQEAVGNLVGKSKTAVASWEQGLSLPDVVTLYKLARHYNKTMDYMYGEE